MRAAHLVVVVGLMLSGCATAPRADRNAHLAHDAYTSAINSNDLDAIMAMMTDDVVFLVPGSPPIEGKPAVREWAGGYLSAYHTHWDKRVVEFIQSGAYAFERYSYTSTDTPRGGGEPVSGTGWGLIVYQRGDDGVWRVARDAFGPDQAPG